MPAPINYMAAMPDISQQFAGLSASLTDYGRVKQEQEAKMRAEQQAQEAQRQYASDLQSAFANPTPQSFAQLVAKYPGQREALGDAAKMVKSGQLEQEFGRGLQISSALESGNPQAAIPLLQEQVDAAKNSGTSPGIYGQILSAIDRGDINAAKGATNFALSIIDPERFGKFAESMGKAEQRPVALEKLKGEAAKTAAEASSAATAAKFAESKAVADLKLTEAQIKKFAEDAEIARANQRLAAARLAFDKEKEKNDRSMRTKELGMKIQEMQDARDTKLREKVATVESGRSSMDNFLNTADRFLSAAIGPDGKPSSTLRAAAGPIDALIPTMQTDVADLEAIAKTMSSQAFLSQIPMMKGTGALTEAEGAKLEASLANLSLKQSPGQIIQNVKEAQRLILKARKNLAAQYGVPDSVPDTPAANPSASEVDALIKKYAR